MTVVFKDPTFWGRIGWVFTFPRFLRVLLAHRWLPAKLTHSLFLLSQVEAVIHPRFLAELLSSEPQLDLLALAEKLEQEEGLTLAEVSQGREGVPGEPGEGGDPGEPGEGDPRPKAHMTLSLFPSCQSGHWGGQLWVGPEQRMGSGGWGAWKGREGLRKMSGEPQPRGSPLSTSPSASLPPSQPCAGQSLSLPSSQLVEKRLVASKVEEGVQAPPRHGTAQSGPGSECEAGPGLGLGVGDKACPPETDGQDLQRHGRAHTHLSRPRAFALSPGRQASPAPRAGRPPSAPQGQRCTSPLLGPRDAPILREARPARDTRGPVDGSSEDEEELPSLAFLLASQHSLLPWGLPQSPTPASGLPSPGGRGPRGAPRAPSPQRIGLSPATPPATKSRKRALCGGSAPAGKAPLPGAPLRGSRRPALAMGLVHPSQPAKRRCDSFVTGRRRKRHCSQ